MDKREAELLNAVKKMRSIIDDGESHGISSWNILSAIDHEIDVALHNYVPPITSDPGFDARDNSSLGMKEDFGMGEGRS